MVAGGGGVRRRRDAEARPAAFWERFRAVRAYGTAWERGRVGWPAPGWGTANGARGFAAPLGEGQPPAGESCGSAVPLRSRFFFPPFSPPASSGLAAGSAAVDSSPSGSRPGVAKLNRVIRNLKMK